MSALVVLGVNKPGLVIDAANEQAEPGVQGKTLQMNKPKLVFKDQVFKVRCYKPNLVLKVMRHKWTNQMYGSR